MSAEQQKKWLTPDELEAEYKISKSTQGKYRMYRKIPYCKIGKYVRYDREEIDKWIASHAVDMIAS